jgi:hypothetical protein
LAWPGCQAADSAARAFRGEEKRREEKRREEKRREERKS